VHWPGKGEASNRHTRPKERPPLRVAAAIRDGSATAADATPVAQKLGRLIRLSGNSDGRACASPAQRYRIGAAFPPHCRRGRSAANQVQGSVTI
jgi:hypothetical protein